MPDRSSTKTFLSNLTNFGEELLARAKRADRPSGEMYQPEFSETEREPVKLTEVRHPDGRMSQYPPAEHWDDWVEWEGKSWPKKVGRHYSLVPTVCFNCESACGLLAYVDKETFEIGRFEGNPAHPGSRGRNCAKGPATHNQVYDPERILYPLKRVGKRGEGKWKRVSWDEVLDDIAQRMRASRATRRDGIMYHVGRPGEDHFANRTITAWGVDGHNSHTNICSAGARAGYAFWTGADRPSPDHAQARVILLISAHLESGHYFNPHAQRIIEGKRSGAKIITLDPRLSNTAARSDLWMPSWPGSEAYILLAIASYLLRTKTYDREFVRRWVNWKTFMEAAPGFLTRDDLKAKVAEAAERRAGASDWSFDDFEDVLTELYSEFTFERAAEEARVSVDSIREAAELISNCDGKLAAHTWRSATMGNKGGWQVARCLFFLNVLTGSVGAPGGTSMNSWHKFVPKPHSQPPPFTAWNDLHLPLEWPFAMYEMSFLLPHFLEEGRGDIDVYFTRVYNPMWINPDGFMWLEALRDEEKVKFHVAMTPTWNESAWFADYVLPMGHASERHDIQSQETHAGQWFAFRQPVQRVARERAGQKIERTWQANPGQVWEEAEFWIDLSVRMDPDGSLGIKQWFESPYREGETITIDEYFRWIFENSVPGLPEKAAEEGLSPLEWMRKYGAFEVSRNRYRPFEEDVSSVGLSEDELGLLRDDSGKAVGLRVEGEAKVGFATPTKRLELFSPTLSDWGWPEQEYVLPWTLESHVHPSKIDRAKGEMLLLPTFRLPTLIHTRSANAKWLYEISHKNPVWIHPEDASRLGVGTGDCVRLETEIGWFVDRVWVTEGIKPGIVAMSHHLGRWRLEQGEGIGAGMSNLVELEGEGTGEHRLHIVEGGGAWESTDPDTSRIWWEDVGVHQNLTHAVHPDPISGAHCWHQKLLSVRKALPTEKHGSVWVDTRKSMAVFREWVGYARSAARYSPDGTRRPYWLKRPLKPTPEAYKIPEDQLEPKDG